MQVVERDGVGPQPAKALLDLGAERLRPPLARTVAALCRDDAFGRDRRERATDRLLAGASCVRVGGVDVTQARGDGLPDEGDVLGRVGETVRPQPDPRHLDVAEPDRAPPVHACDAVAMAGRRSMAGRSCITTILTAGLAALLSACSGGAGAPSPSTRTAAAGSPSRIGGDWQRFGYDATRHGAGPRATGITPANVGGLRRQRVQLGGTADSSPIYLRGVR